MAEKNNGQIYSTSGIPIKDIYTPEDVKKIDYEKDIGSPGKPPYTRGVYASMYRGQLWTIRPLTGYDSPEATNGRYKEEYALGQTGFSIAPDISTASGMDPDGPRVEHDIGHAGVPIYSVEDMETVFKVHEEIVCFDSMDELKTLIAHYLAHPEERERIADAAYRRVIREHTYDVRAAQILDIIHRR